MSHFAKINANNVVTQVIVAEQSYINSGAVGDSFLWIQTSYNNNFRKQYAGTGFTYDRVNDVFIGMQPHKSWTLNSDFDWEAPVARPDGGKTYKPYAVGEVTDANRKKLQFEDKWGWDEDKQKWIEQVYDPDLDPDDWDTATQELEYEQDTSDMPDLTEDLDSPRIVTPFQYLVQHKKLNIHNPHLY